MAWSSSQSTPGGQGSGPANAPPVTASAPATPYGRYAYGANYTLGTISSFRVGRNDSLSLLDSVAGTTDHPGNIQGSTPLDMSVSPDGRYLYVVLPGSDAIDWWDGRAQRTFSNPPTGRPA